MNFSRPLFWKLSSDTHTDRTEIKFHAASRVVKNDTYGLRVQCTSSAIVLRTMVPLSIRASDVIQPIVNIWRNWLKFYRPSVSTNLVNGDLTLL